MTIEEYFLNESPDGYSYAEGDIINVEVAMQIAENFMQMKMQSYHPDNKQARKAARSRTRGDENGVSEMMPKEAYRMGFRAGVQWSAQKIRELAT